MTKNETYEEELEQTEEEINSGDKAENIVSSVFKLSISTFLNMGVYVFLFLFANLLVSKSLQGKMGIFTNYTNTFMTIAILGLDQAFLRFFHEPPGKSDSNSLFRQCLYFSGSLLLFLGLLCSTVFLTPMYELIGLTGGMGKWIVPIIFLNAGFYMVARYINVYLRMEMKIFAYTLQGFLTQVLFRLIYLVGARGSNPEVTMILVSLIGMGLFAIVQILIYRKITLPKKGTMDLKSYKTILPFGLFTAPTAIFTSLNASLPLSLITQYMVGNKLQIEDAVGDYSIAFSLSNIVSMIQGGFATFWTPYVYKNYKTHQKQIKDMHDFINFIIFVFFCLLVAFEDIIFLILFNYASVKAIFPLMMLSAVFNILCTTTVLGNALMRRPILDTIGMGIGLLFNVVGCVFLIPRFGINGAVVALVIGNGASYIFRTITAQKLYCTINNPLKTIIAFIISFGITALGTIYTHNFLMKFVFSMVGILVYCILYRSEFKRTLELGISILKQLWNSITGKSKAKSKPKK